MALEGLVHRLQKKNPESRFAGFLQRHERDVGYLSLLVSASAAAMAVSAGAAEAFRYLQMDAVQIASYTTATEMVSYCTVFSGLFYRRHKDRYKDPTTQRTSWKNIFIDLVKMGLATSPSGGLFYLIAYPLNRHLLLQAIWPWASATLSYLGAIVPSSALAMVLAKKVGLIRRCRGLGCASLPKEQGKGADT